MSFSAMTWARTVSFGSPIRKAIAYTLADHHNGDSGRCDPGVETIAREADASVRATEINLRWMERVGALTVLRRQGRPNCYILNFDWGAAQARPTCQQRKRRTTAPDAGVSMLTPAFECVGTVPTPAPGSPKSEREDSTGKKEERVASADAPAPTPVSPSVEIFLAKEGKRPRADRPRKRPLPDDWCPPLEVRQLAEEAGYDPAEIMEEMADWARETEAQSADWAATCRRWIRREQRWRSPARQSQQRGKRTVADDIAERLFSRGRAMA